MRKLSKITPYLAHLSHTAIQLFSLLDSQVTRAFRTCGSCSKKPPTVRIFNLYMISKSSKIFSIPVGFAAASTRFYADSTKTIFDFEALDIDGKNRKLSEFQGRIR